MKKTCILYISGSLGLGHIGRDIAIANQLRKLIAGVEIDWIASDPATIVLLEAGEKLVPGIEQYTNENLAAETAAKGSQLNIFSYLMKSRGEWQKNVEFFLDLISKKQYDLIIGDEAYEITLAMREHPEKKNFPFVMIYDFVGLHAMSKNPLELLGVYYWNRVWSHDYRHKRKPSYDLGLFVGELEDIPDDTFGFMMPRRRDFAKAMYTFIGYVFPFEPAHFSDKPAVRIKLGYDHEPLVICSMGGTAIGKELLELCGKACILVKKSIPALRVILVTGPRLDPDSLQLPEDITIKGFIPKLYEHFAACDLAIVQGGATSTLELTALRIPFIYFPIEGHCEQASVARMLERHGAGLHLILSQTTPELLAEEIIKMLGTTVSYPEIPKDGALKAAQVISSLLI
ncbi:MAG: hypothetical protein JW830_08120 [Bacteroidales bacterium]|nr:hypothetical protein [Bacteroidales bacterium]